MLSEVEAPTALRLRPFGPPLSVTMVLDAPTALRLAQRDKLRAVAQRDKLHVVAAARASSACFQAALGF
jgi:hypothetical protein